METQQARHTIPTAKQSRPLYGSGIERTLPYMLSTDFVDVAEEDGVVEKVDNKNELAIIKYKSGKTKVIDLSSRQSKNSNGGFYISNQKELLLNEGQKFKANDILAKNPQYFLGDKSNDVTFAQGFLAKVAVACGDFTLEDSSIITEETSRNMSTMVTMMKSVALGPNANVISMVKKGSHVKTGETLISFEHSFDDAEANKLLDSLDDDASDFIEGLGQDTVVSKYSGEIVDIKIFYNVDLELLSDSLQDIIKKYNNDVTKRKNIADKNNATNMIFPPNSKIESDKIKGRSHQGIIIEFYIRHSDLLQCGDKIVYGTAIKTIVSDVIPDGEEPYSDYHPDEKIDAIYSPLSVVSRMTTDSYNMLYTNKVIVELKNKCRDIWNS